jgi:hypothetical protein
VCDVLVVQTSALDEDRLRDDRLYKRDEADRSPAGATADRTRTTEADTGG